MPDLRFQSQPARHTEIPRPKRAEGQWSLGYTEPLNKNEQSKKDDDPLNVRDRILHIYSKRGFDSIDPADLRGRFRWMGLYTQRKPGIDGGKTAVLEEEELDDRYFMMRVRSDGRLLPARGRARAGQHRRRLRPRHRRRHRPREHPVPLDPHRGRPRDLGPPRRRRAQQPRGLRRLTAPVPRLAGRRRREGRDHRRLVGAGGDLPPLHRRPALLQPAAQVQDGRDRPPEPRRLPRDQRRGVRRHGAPRARPGLRPVGRRRAVHQPHAGPACRRLDPARGGARRLGGRRLGLPRLRLPPAALARPPEVPGRRLGHRQVPRGPRERVPRPPAGPHALAAVSRGPSRPRRRARAERRRPLCRRRPDGRPGLRHRPAPAGRPDGRVRRPRRAPDAVPEDRADRRQARGRRPAAAQARRDRPVGPPVAVAAEHHGLHGHRVLQARHRRHQGPRPRPGRRARASLPRPRHPDHRQRQRLPQRLRPHAVRRHRPQGPAGPRRPWQPGRGLPGPPRRGDRAQRELRPQAARPQGDQRRARRLHHSRRHGVPRRSARRASPSPPGWSVPTRPASEANAGWRPSHEPPRQPVPLPLLRGAGPLPTRGRPTVGSAAPACGRSRSPSSARSRGPRVCRHR